MSGLDIPLDWCAPTVDRTCRSCQLHIRVENPDHVQKGVQRIAFNGTAVQGSILTEDLLRDRSQAEVLVIMG